MPDNMHTMALRRFHCDPLPSSGFVTLDADQSAHARKSLRLAVGDRIELFDGLGSVAQAAITDLSRTLTAVIESHHTAAPPVPALALAVAIPKGPRADTLIDQAAQLGVTHLIPLLTARSVVEPRDKKVDRFRRIVIEACKQSHRPHFMTVADPTPLDAVLRSATSFDSRLIADIPSEAVALQCDGSQLPGVQNMHASPASPPTLTQARSVIVLIGPEGGWTDDERSAARSAGFSSISLGSYVLRVETAALAAAAIIRMPQR